MCVIGVCVCVGGGGKKRGRRSNSVWVRGFRNFLTGFRVLGLGFGFRA